MEAKARRLAVNIYHALLVVSTREAAQAFQADVEKSDGTLGAMILIVRKHLGVTVLVDDFLIEQAEKAAAAEEEE